MGYRKEVTANLRSGKYMGYTSKKVYDPRSNLYDNVKGQRGYVDKEETRKKRSEIMTRIWEERRSN